MLTKIHSHNFRGFRQFDTRIEAITAFLGPNSSGKTTALHLVRLGCEALHLALDAQTPARVEIWQETRWIVVTNGTLVDPARLLPLADWRALFVNREVGDGVMFTVRLSFEEADPVQEIHVDVVCARNEQLKLNVWVRAAAALQAVEGLARKSPAINQRLSAYLRDHAPVAVFVPPFYGTVRDEEYRSRAIVDRMLGAGDQSHVVRNLVVGLDADQLDRLNGFLEATVGARLTRRTAGDELQSVTRLLVHFRDNNGEIELSAAGAGLINLVALYTALSRWRVESARRRVLFLLDEPEAHLHPRLQAESAERLGRLVTREFAAQILLATHSVDILNRLSSNGALLVRTDRTAEPSAVALESDAALFDDLADWVDLEPYTAINALAARRVVFCEGDDDLAVLPRLAELRFRNDPGGLARFRRWAFVRLHGASNVPVARLVTRLVRNDVVRARANAGARFRVHVVLDRDHAREPGTRSEEIDGVVETTTVWSRHSLESLFLLPEILTAWARAYLGEDAPDDLPALVRDAVAAADRDEALHDRAIEQLAARLLGSELLDPHGRPLGGEQKSVHAVREATALVRSEPAIWQRGKSRGTFVLGAIRANLPIPARNRFPTELARLVARADLNRIGDPAAAIPVEVGALLDQLAAP